MKRRAPDARAALQRKLISFAVASCFVAEFAYANPTGPAVAAGTASFGSAGSVLTVTNSPNAIINWRGFSIGVGEITRFQQQSASSAVLNRVTGQDPSAILGTLWSNGKVFLVNPNGILFGQGSRVDVGGLVASTLNITNQDFLTGRLNFQAGAVANSIVNQGELRSASGGNIYVIAPDVTNSGLISSPKGEVILAAGKSVSLVDVQTPNLKVEVAASEGEARNLGQIVADSGRIGIYAGLISQQGVVRADTVEAGKNGEIVFRASKDVTLTAGSVTSASGAAGGANDGGTVRVMSDGTIDMQSGSSLRAEGGPAGGNGGLLELSGKGKMQLAGSYSTRALAPAYRSGTIVLDPENVDIFSGICIVDLCLDPLINLTGAANVIVTATRDLRVLTAIATANLDPGATLQLDASNNLTISAPIGTALTRFDHDVTLRAGNNVVVNNNIYMASRTLTLAANVNALDATRTLLTLPDPGNTLAGDVIIAPAGVALFVDTLGPLNVTGVNFIVQGGGSFNASGGAVDRSATLNANAISANVTGNILIAGGDNVTATAIGPGTTNSGATSDATLSAATSVSLSAGGSLTIRGGNGSSSSPAANANGGNNSATVNANALVSGGGTVTLTAGTVAPNTLAIRGGNSAFAKAVDAASNVTTANTATANAKATVRSTGGAVNLSAPGGSLMISGGSNAKAVAGLDAVGAGPLTGNNGATANADVLVSAQGGLTISNTSSVTIAGGDSAKASAWKWAPASGANITGTVTANASANATLGAGTSLSINLTPGTLTLNGRRAIALASEEANAVTGSTISGTNTATANSNISLTGGTGFSINVGTGSVDVNLGWADASAFKTVSGGASNAVNATNMATANSKISLVATTGNFTLDAASLSINNGSGPTAKAYVSVSGGSANTLGGANNATADTRVVMDAAAGNMTLTLNSGMTVNGNSASASAYHSVSGGLNHIVTTSNTANADASILFNASGGLNVGYPGFPAPASAEAFAIYAARGSAGASKTVSGSNHSVSGANNTTLTSNITLQAGSGGLTIRSSTLNISGGTEASPQAFHSVSGNNNTVGGNNSATSNIKIVLSTTGGLTLAADAGGLNISGGSARANAFKGVSGGTPGNGVSGVNNSTADTSIAITGATVTVSATGAVSIRAGSAAATATHFANGNGHNISGDNTATANTSVGLSSTSGLLQISGTSLTVQADGARASATRFLTSASNIGVTGNNTASANAGVSILGNSGLTINLGTGTMHVFGSGARASASKTIPTGTGNNIGGNETANASSKIDIGATAGSTTITVGSLMVSGSSARASAFKMANSAATANTLSGTHTANADSTITLSASGTLSIAASGASGVALSAGGFTGAAALAMDTPNGNTLIGVNAADAKANAKLSAANVSVSLSNAAANFAPLDGPISATGAGATATSRAELLGTSSVSVAADNIDITNGHLTSAPTGTVILAPFTASRNIAIESSPTAGLLSLTPGEIGNVSTGTLQIGRSDGTGTLSVNAALEMGAYGALTLAHGNVNVSGNITKSSGADASLSLIANNSIQMSGGADVTSTSNKLNVVLNSDADASGAGRIALGSGTVITSNGGNVTLGGGANPLTANAFGDAPGGGAQNGVLLVGATINSGAGNISIRGTGAPGTMNARGVQLDTGSVLQTTSGSITVNGTGGNGTLGGGNRGIFILDTGTQITSVDGTITLTGQGGSSTGLGTNPFPPPANIDGRNRGIDISDGPVISTSGTGNIVLTGTGGASVDAGSNTGVLLSQQSAIGTRITTVNGNISITGTGGSTSAGTAVTTANRGISIGAAEVRSTGTGSVSLTGTGGTTNNNAANSSNSGLLIQGDPDVVGIEAFVTTASGNLSVTGTAGSSTAAGTHEGIIISNLATVQSGGSGALTLTGTSAAGNPAIRLSGGGAALLPAHVHVEGGGALNVAANGGFLKLETFGGLNNQFVELVSPGNQTINAGGIVLTGGPSGSGNTVEIGTAGNQTITVGSGGIAVTGGGTGPNFAMIDAQGNQTITVNGGDVSVVGNAGLAQIMSGGNQTLTLQGASSANALTIGSASSVAASAITGSNQAITAGQSGQLGEIIILGGTGAGRSAAISNSSGTQTVSTSGRLLLLGGTATGTATAPGTCNGQQGSGSCASIQSIGTGLQTVSANQIVIKGGSAGVSNGAGIFVNGGSSQINVGVGGLLLQTGFNGTAPATGTANFATIGGGGAAGQTLTVSVAGDTILDASKGTLNSGVLIGLGGSGNAQSVTVNFTSPGDLTLNASDVANAGAGIGSGAFVTNATTTVNINARNITVNAGDQSVVGARIGHPNAVNGNGPGNISITASTLALNASVIKPPMGAAIRTLGNVTITAGSMTEGPNSAILVGGTTALNGGSILLTSNNNDFTGAVSLNNTGSPNVAITDANAIVLGASSLGTGTLTVTAGGTITQTGPIVQAAGAGQATFDSTGGGAITLTNASNDFTGPVDLGTTGAVAITDANSFIINGGGGGGNNPSSLTINANGAVTQSAAFTGSAPTVIVINAGPGPITLNNAVGSPGTELEFAL